MNRWRACLAAVFLLWGSSAAVDAKSRTAVFDWSGFYFGVDLGMLQADSDYAYFNPIFRTEVEPRGIVGGLHLGHRWQLPSNFVIGVEADFWLTDAQDFGAFFNGTSHPFVEAHGGASLRGILGRSFGRALLYVTAGAAFAKMDSCNTSTLIGGNCTPRSILGSWMNGWTAGAGIAHALSQHVTLRAEYLYADYGSATLHSNLLAGGGLGLSLTSQTYRLGVSWHFGG